MEVRVCESADDEGQLRGFLEDRPDDPVAVLIRSNLCLAKGLARQANVPFSGQHYGLFDGDGRLLAVAVHYWNGCLMLAWPDEFRDQLDLQMDRPVTRIEGCDGVSLAHLATRLAADPLHVQHKPVFRLDLTSITNPFPVAPDHFVDRARTDDLPLVAAWRQQHLLEAYGPSPAGDYEAVAERWVREMQPALRLLIDKEGEEAQAMLSYNALLPDAAVIGGLFVPAELRRQGRARQLLHGALNGLRGDGLSRVLLYTGAPAAEALYRSAGFAPCGQMAILNIK